MLEIGMYVRCPIDKDSLNPRDFIMGQITEIDEIAEQVRVKFNDPYGFRKYYEHIPQGAIFSKRVVQRCEFFKHSYVEYKNKRHMVIAKDNKKESGWNHYYLQSVDDKKIVIIRENDINAPFTGGKVSPYIQLLNYEFQNPCWYFGRSIVSKTMHVLDHSVYGFKELAGCKIFLMSHQLYTIMRCLQEKECRYMLADEVGLGKTIEACSVLKIYLSNVSKAKVLIVVPKALLEQWRVELINKFDLLVGMNQRNNEIKLVSYEELNSRILHDSWDFLIADEVHNTLKDENVYKNLRLLSTKVKNILLLSATPVQQKKLEYLKLLKLILPERYGMMGEEEFECLLEKQNMINKKVYGLLGDLTSLQEEVDAKIEELEEGAPVLLHEDQDCQDMFEEIIDGLNEVAEIIANEHFEQFLEKIHFEEEDLGISSIQTALSYLCENYQIEKSIIRNRRYFIEDLANRRCKKVTYKLDADINMYEANTYQILMEWIEERGINEEEFIQYFIPLISTFFSSPWAFLSKLREFKIELEVPNELEEYAAKWVKDEERSLSDLDQVLENPDETNSRIIKVIDYIDQEIIDRKTVIFTNYSQTFKQYKKQLIQYFGEDRCAVFNKRMSKDELELNVYRFQQDQECFIMLCDESGGEGRNFQCADYVIHIDLPWDANAIEQRIGRLDRIGREADRDVISVVFYTEETIEQQLFRFWDEGLNLFNKSLSGLEIVMKDINDSIMGAILSNFKYGLETSIEKIIEMSKKLEKEVRAEQHFDTTAYKYNSLNQELNYLVEYYNKNENKIFADTMLNWAQLAGFKQVKSESEQVVCFNDQSFSTASASNSMLIPPNWEQYINTDKNLYINHILGLYDERKGNKNKEVNGNRTIRGTFDRKQSIGNDYLHFFAPGDEIFDCIAENALKSTKGQVAAFACKASIDWKGIVFSWSIEANEQLLLDAGISLNHISRYRNFLPMDQIQVFVPLNATYREIPEKEVRRVFNNVLAQNYDQYKENNNIAHLGRRARYGNSDFLGYQTKYNESNIECFKSQYPEENWTRFLNDAYRSALQNMKIQVKRRSNIKGAKEEISRMIATRKATNDFYNHQDYSAEQFERICELIIESLSKPKPVLESACVIWMVKQ